MNINWKRLSRNPDAINLIRENPDKIVLEELCKNPERGTLLQEHFGDRLYDILLKDDLLSGFMEDDPYWINVSWIELCKSGEEYIQSFVNRCLGIYIKERILEKNSLLSSTNSILN